MIPPFGQGNVLPPFMGDDAAGHFLPRSPYIVSMSELVARFATSHERVRILEGLLDLRARLMQIGFDEGFQWIDGSFVENCEEVKGRPPNDVDVVSLLRRPPGLDELGWDQLIEQNQHTLFSAEWTKEQFRCDTYYIDLAADQRAVAEESAYWFGLFSHQRTTFRWKGMVQLDLISDDGAARATLGALENML